MKSPYIPISYWIQWAQTTIIKMHLAISFEPSVSIRIGLSFFWSLIFYIPLNIPKIALSLGNQANIGISIHFHIICQSRYAKILIPSR